MTLEQKAKAYDEAIEKAKDMLSYGEMRREDVEHLFPSLIESEEDRIRVAITRFLLKNGKYAIEMYGCTIKEATDWLEKQGKCESDCPQNHQDVNHPNGCITMEDFSGGEGFYKLNIEYLNKRQVEEIEEIVRTWNKDADCDLCTSKEHCISIEKQSKQDG